jgi:hypothetical protein
MPTLEHHFAAQGHPAATNFSGSGAPGVSRSSTSRSYSMLRSIIAMMLVLLFQLLSFTEAQAGPSPCESAVIAKL